MGTQIIIVKFISSDAEMDNDYKKIEEMSEIEGISILETEDRPMDDEEMMLAKSLGLVPDF